DPDICSEVIAHRCHNTASSLPPLPALLPQNPHTAVPSHLRVTTRTILRHAVSPSGCFLLPPDRRQQKNIKLPLQGQVITRFHVHHVCRVHPAQTGNHIQISLCFRFGTPAMQQTIADGGRTHGDVRDRLS